MPEAGKTATSYQFMRQGYFCLDNRDAKPGPSGLQPQRLFEGQF